MPERLHHMAFRCRDSEATRAFYEDVIGLPLAAALEIDASKTGRPVRALHTFFRLNDGSHLAFFEVPDDPFEFKRQDDFDLHIALEATPDEISRVVEQARARGLEVRGPSDHGFIRSHYFRDPDGYVLELTVRTGDHETFERQAPQTARGVLEAWIAGLTQVRRA